MFSKPKFRTVLPALLIAARLPAQAQTAPAPAKNTEEPVSLSAFVVSDGKDIGYRATNAMGATKTNTPIQETPQSIQVINNEFILDQGALSLDDAMRYTSGVSIGTDLRGDRYSMRGYVTGIPSKDYFRDTGRTPREMSNISRVEVVKGPAAFTFGRTNPGGVINLVVKRPLYDPETTVTGVVGSDSLYRAELDTTGPIDAGHHLAYRAIGAWEDAKSPRDGFFVKRKFVTPSLLLQITPDTSLRVETEYLYDNRTPNRGLVMINGQVPSYVPLTENYQWDGSRITTTQYNYFAELLHKINSHISLRLATRYNNADEFSYVTNVSAVNATTGALTRTVQRSNDVVVDNRYTQAEILVQGDTFGIQHSILGGTEIGWNDTDSIVDQATLPTTNIVNPDTHLAPGVFAPNSNVRTDTAFKSLYLQDQLFFFDHHLTALVGVRRDQFSQNAINRRVTPASFQYIEGQYVDPHYGLAWMPTKELMVYATYSTANVPPTQANPDGAVLQPAVGKIKEVGAKTTFLDERLTSTFALYQVDQDNVSVVDPTRINYLINAGSRQNKGAELDTTWIISNQWTALVSLAYNSGRVTSDTQLPIGSPLPRNPKRAATVWTRYDFKHGIWKNLTLGLGWIYADGSYADNVGAIFLPGYNRWDALVRYRYKKIDVSVNFRNLTDRRYFQSAASNFDVLPGLPFSVETSVRVRF